MVWEKIEIIRKNGSSTEVLQYDRLHEKKVVEQEPSSQHTVRMKKSQVDGEKKKNQIITGIIHCSKEN